MTSVDGLIFCVHVTPSVGGMKSSAELRKVRHSLTCNMASFCQKYNICCADSHNHLRLFSQRALLGGLCNGDGPYSL